MLGTGLCTLLKVLVLAGAGAALLPEDLEDRAVPASLQEECASKCPNLDLTQCTKGCEAWEQALDTSCQAVCVTHCLQNGTQELLPPKELYCVLGCHDALNRYFQQLKDLHRVLRVERRVARVHLVYQHTEAPPVDRLAVAL
ncbi:hypothetical protein X777_11641 [Ooceraea biroi]|uniref:Saposin A-type domain-containing protein n=1 Tax=Ooceraea biroi TaxID=2015173 RepID=A0A026W3Z8_OOCBI|nr:hypothetical protein X777_11641 [Ooceraea biroi]